MMWSTRPVISRKKKGAVWNIFTVKQSSLPMSAGGALASHQRRIRLRRKLKPKYGMSILDIERLPGFGGPTGDAQSRGGCIPCDVHAFLFLILCFRASLFAVGAFLGLPLPVRTIPMLARPSRRTSSRRLWRCCAGASARSTQATSWTCSVQRSPGQRRPAAWSRRALALAFSIQS